MAAGSSGRFDYSYSYTTGGGEWSSPGVKTGPYPQSKSSDCEFAGLGPPLPGLQRRLRLYRSQSPRALHPRGPQRKGLRGRLARHALGGAHGHGSTSTRKPAQGRVQVLVNNSDGQGNSYGSHLNFLLSREAWENIFHRKPHQLAWLASYQASSIVFTGQGKVGRGEQRPGGRVSTFAACRLLRDADRQPNHVRSAAGEQPRRGPLRNAGYHALRRRTPADFARLHCIFYDSNLCHVACLLKVGVMQIVLAMLEGGCVNPTLILDDPLEAVGRFSHDPRLQARARMASGKKLTAVELQLSFLEEAGKFCRPRRLRSGRSPRRRHPGTLRRHAAESFTRATWTRLRRGWTGCSSCGLSSGRWHNGLGLAGTPPKSSFSTTSTAVSIRTRASIGFTRRRASPSPSPVPLKSNDSFTSRRTTPAPSRRARLLRLANPDQINSVNWDSIGFRLAGGSGWPVYRMLEMADPLAFTKADTAALFDSAEPLETILDALTQYRFGWARRRRYVAAGDRAYPQEQLLLPAPTPRPTSVGSAVGDSDLIIPLRERFHEPEGGQDDAAT